MFEIFLKKLFNFGNFQHYAKTIILVNNYNNYNNCNNYYNYNFYSNNNFINFKFYIFCIQYK